jgi:hypothetical protein
MPLSESLARRAPYCPARDGYWDLHLHVEQPQATPPHAPSQAHVFLDALLAFGQGAPDVVRRYFPDTRLALIVNHPMAVGSIPSDLPAAQSALEKAQQLGMPAFWGFRMMDNRREVVGVNPITYRPDDPVDPASTPDVTFATGWMSPLQWQRNADFLNALLAGLRDYPAQNYLQLDMEAGWITDYEVPTLEALAQTGHTLDDLRRAMAPFLAAVESSGMVPYMYPASPDDIVMPLIAAASRGRAGTLLDHKALVCSQTTYGAARHHRRDPERQYLLWAAGQQALRTRILEACGPDVRIGLALYDDIYRHHGDDLRDDHAVLGPHEGLVFMRNRVDVALVGTPAWHQALHYASHNDVRYDWALPNLHQGNIARSYGTAPAPLPLISHRASPNNTVAYPAPTRRYDLDPDERIQGIRLDAPDPAGGWTFHAYRATNAFPTGAGATTWSVRVRFRVPANAADAPIFSQSPVNLRSWQVAKMMVPDAQGVLGPHIVLQVAGSPPVPLAPYVADRTYSVFLGRRGATSWAFCVDGGPVTQVTLANAPSYENFILGGGWRPDAFQSPPPGTHAAGMNDIVFLDDLAIWWRALSDAEAQATCTGSFPWGVP